MIDANADGTVDYGEFTRAFIGRMNEARKQYVRKVRTTGGCVYFIMLTGICLSVDVLFIFVDEDAAVISNFKPLLVY